MTRCGSAGPPRTPNREPHHPSGTLPPLLHWRRHTLANARAPCSDSPCASACGVPIRTADRRRRRSHRASYPQFCTYLKACLHANGYPYCCYNADPNPERNPYCHHNADHNPYCHCNADPNPDYYPHSYPLSHDHCDSNANPHTITLAHSYRRAAYPRGRGRTRRSGDRGSPGSLRRFR